MTRTVRPARAATNYVTIGGTRWSSSLMRSRRSTPTAVRRGHGCPRLSRPTDFRAQRHQAEPTSTRAADNIFIRSGYGPPGAHESLNRERFVKGACWISRVCGWWVWSAGWVGGPAGCARRAVRLIYADPGGRRTMVRRGVPLCRIGRGQPRTGWVLIADWRVSRACRAATDPADGGGC
jgi:hypothetical protein